MEALEDRSEGALIHCLRALHKLIVHHANSIEKRHQHHLGSANVFPGFLRPCLSSSEPFLGLGFELRIVNIHPRLIHGNYMAKYSPVVPLQATPKVADLAPAVALHLGQISWNILSTSLCQMQVQVQDPVDGGGGDATLDTHVGNVGTPVFSHHVLDLPDVGSASSRLGLVTPGLVHDARPASLEFPDPVVDGFVSQRLRVHSGQGSLDLTEAPPQFDTKVHIYSLLQVICESCAALHAADVQEAVWQVRKFPQVQTHQLTRLAPQQT